MMSIKHSNCAFPISSTDINKPAILVAEKEFDYVFPISNGHIFKQNFKLLVRSSDYLFEISFGFGTIDFRLSGSENVLKSIEYEHKDADKIRRARERVENMSILEFFKFIENTKN